MYDFLLQIITFSALAAIVAILARALPRVSEIETGTQKANYLDRFLKRLPLSKIDANINAFWDKLLRRLKVIILKVDNLVNKLLHRVKKTEAKSESLPQAVAQPEQTEENKNVP